MGITCLVSHTPRQDGLYDDAGGGPADDTEAESLLGRAGVALVGQAYHLHLGPLADELQLDTLLLLIWIE